MKPSIIIYNGLVLGDSGRPLKAPNKSYFIHQEVDANLKNSPKALVDDVLG